jgi:hypothetical protein
VPEQLIKISCLNKKLTSKLELVFGNLTDFVQPRILGGEPAKPGLSILKVLSIKNLLTIMYVYVSWSNFIFNFNPNLIKNSYKFCT